MNLQGVLVKERTPISLIPLIHAFKFTGDPDPVNEYYKETVIKEYVTPNPGFVCKECHQVLSVHGYCETPKGGRIACPSDMIILGIQGYYPCKLATFHKTHEHYENHEYVPMEDS